MNKRFDWMNDETNEIVSISIVNRISNKIKLNRKCEQITKIYVKNKNISYYNYFDYPIDWEKKKVDLKMMRIKRVKTVHMNAYYQMPIKQSVSKQKDNRIVKQKKR